MSTVLIGIDLAKSVFQFHGLDAQGKVTLRKHVNRKDFLPFFERMPPGCHVAMEACGTAHHWGRRLQEMGHRVTLLPAHRVKAYGAPGKKNDANDAAAIAEAASRPHIQPIPVKSIEQQAVLALHTSRGLLVRQRTALVNALRGHLAEFGYVAPKGIERLPQLLRILETGTDQQDWQCGLTLPAGLGSHQSLEAGRGENSAPRLGLGQRFAEAQKL